MGVRSASDRWLDGGVLAFAGFTLTANLTVAIAGSLHVLGVLTLLAAAAGGAVFLVQHQMHGFAADPAPTPPETESRAGTADGPQAGGEGLPPLWVFACLLVGVAGVAAYWSSDSTIGIWAATLVVSVAVLVRECRPGANETHSPRPMRVRALVPILALLCALVVSFAHRADDDDAFYLNLAVAAVDQPDRPLLTADTLHGYPAVPLGLPVFKVLSYELGLALLSLASDVDVLMLAHVVLPPLFAALIPLAWARLFRRVAPQLWPWLLAALIASFFLLGEGRANHGDFALLRLQQGKSVLLHVLWPLMALAGIEFGQRRSGAAWVVLAASQIAAVGLSTTALWLAPVVAGLGVVTGIIEGSINGTFASRVRAPRIIASTLACGALASSHAVGFALALREETVSAFRNAPHPLPSLAYSSERLMTDALEMVGGPDGHTALLGFAVSAGIALAASASLRRFLAVYAIALTVLFWNPVGADSVARQITGPDTYFRVMWIWPLPVFVAVLMTAAGFALKRRGEKRVLIVASAFVGSALLVFGVGGAVPTLSAANEARLAAPGAKIPPDELAMARAIASVAGPDDFVLLPPDPSRWLPLLHHHPHPLVVREMLLDVLDERFGQAELQERAALTRMVGGETRLPRGGERLALAIENVPLQAVLITGSTRHWADVIDALEESALERVEENDQFEVWAR